MLIADESRFLKRSGQMYRNHKQRAAKWMQELRFTLEELRQKARHAVSCPYCGIVLTELNFTLDHMIPVGRRNDPYTWHLANLLACCRPCNEAKGSLLHDEFRQLMAVVQRFTPQSQTSVLSRLRAGAVRIYAKGKR